MKIRLILGASILLIASNVQASLYVSWEGVCTIGCTGTATGLLTLKDSFVPPLVTGTPEKFYSDDFISFEFHSDTLSFTISELAGPTPDPNDSPHYGEGQGWTLPQTTPYFEDVDLDTLPGSLAFRTGDGSGGWSVYTTDTPSSTIIGGHPQNQDEGTHGWTILPPVPVPAAIWLFGTAHIGLVGFGKRRKAA